MHSGLKKLLNEIDPKYTIDAINRKVDAAIQTFSNKSFSNYNEFVHLIGDFYQYVHNAIYEMDSSIKLPAGFAIGYARGILSQNRYGARSIENAYDIASTGVEGGLRQVISDLAMGIAQTESGRRIEIKVYDFWNSLSEDEWNEVVDSYLENYGHLFPSDVLEGRALKIRLNMPQVLIKHPYTVRGLRSINL